MADTETFSWSSDNDSVVVRSYGSIAVYENPHGDIVIRQEASPLSDEDTVVVIARQNAEEIVLAIQNLIEPKR